MKNVYVLLDDNDIDEFYKKNVNSQYIVTDLAFYDEGNLVFEPKVRNESNLVGVVDNWYRRVCQDLDINYGYVNNFYECSVRPLLGFLNTICNIINRENGNVVFHLGHKPIYLKETSTYFLAEYESMGVKLYDRRSTFIPYIVDLLERLKIDYLFESFHFKSQVLLGPLRRSLVFAYRTLQAIKTISKSDVNENPGRIVFDNCFALRTVGQARLIIGYLNNTKLNTLVMLSGSSLGDDALSYLQSHVKNNCVVFVKCTNLPLSKVIFRYFKSITSPLKTTTLNIDGTELDLTNALKEINIMQVELMSYHDSMIETIKRYQFSDEAVFHSLEFSSPHAYVDTLVANSVNLPAVQIQPGDKEQRPLPSPIFSQLLCAKNTNEVQKHAKYWLDSSHKIKYVGTFGKNILISSNSKNSSSRRIQICIFTGAHRSVNKIFISELQAKYNRGNVDFFIKKHPRDNLDYSVYNIVKGIVKEDSNMYDRYSYFDISITYPSTVINELILLKMPYLIYVPNHKDYTSYRELTEDLSDFTVCYSSDSLFSCINNYQEEKINCLLKIESYLKLNKFVFDPVLIEKNIRKLVLDD